MISPNADILVTVDDAKVSAHHPVDGTELWPPRMVSELGNLTEDPFVYFTPDGDHVVIEALRDDALNIVVVDTATGDSDSTPVDLPCESYGLVPDGSRLIHLDRPLLMRSSAFVDGRCGTDTLWLIDLETGVAEEEMSFGVDDQAVWTTDTSGRYLATSLGGRATIVDRVTGNQTQLGLVGSIASAALNTDRTLLVTTGTNLITVWDVTTDSPVLSVQTDFPTNHGYFSRDGSVFFAHGGDGVWGVETGTALSSIDTTTLMSTSGDGRLVATSADVPDEVFSWRHGHNRVLVWNLGARGEVGAVRLPPGTYPPQSLEVANGRGAILRHTNGSFGSAILFDPRSGVIEREVESVAGDDIALSADGRYLAFQQQMSDDTFGTIRVRDLETGSTSQMDGICEQDLAGQLEFGCGRYPTMPFGAWVMRLSFTPSGTQLVASVVTDEVEVESGWIEDRQVIVWDTRTGELIRVFSGQTNHELSPSGDRLHLMGPDTMVVVEPSSWSQMSAHNVACQVAEFSPDGRSLHCYAEAAGLRSWNTATWKTNARRKDAVCTDLAVSPDDSVLACAEARGVVTIYDAATLDLLQEIPFGRPVTNVGFITNDHLLVVPRSGPGLVVTTDADELLDIAKRHSRNRWGLTQDECSTYHIDPCPTD